MLEELKKLVDKLTGDEKSKVQAEIKRLEGLGLISRPKDLDTLLADKEFADFKSQSDKREGELRTKWDDDQEKKEDELKAANKPETKTEMSETEKLLTEQLKAIRESIAGLTSSKKVSDLKVYTEEKAKTLPKEFQGLINVTEHSTQEAIDKQIDQITTAHTEMIKTIDQSPTRGKITGPTDVEFNDRLSDFGDNIESQKK